MATPVIMPRQGQSVESCIISEWFKKKGDTVKKGEILLTYETDKASFELEAPDDGVLLDIFFGIDDDVPVLENIAVIGNAEEKIDTFKPGTVKAEPENLTNQKSDQVAQGDNPPVPSTASAGLKRVSPRARLMAEKLGIPLDAVSGTGPNGRIIARDIESYNSNGVKTYVEAAPKEHQPLEEKRPEYKAQATSTQIFEDTEIKKISNVRRLIAEGMQRSLQNSAQLTHHMGADARKILSLRNRFKTTADKAGITLNDMICHAVIRALKKHTEANCHFLGDTIRIFKKVHLGIAVDTERGLMVPAIKNADDLSLQGLSNQLKAIANACKKGNIDPDLLSGTSASFTVSNLGAFGVEMFTPVLNLPQVGILGVNTIISRPADLGDGVFGFVPYLGLSLTYDHRALDGAPASAFLRSIKEEIENFEYKD